MHVPIKAAVEAEVGHVGRNHLYIATVVTTHRNGHSSTARVGDVHRPMVVASDVRAHLLRSHVDVGLLSGAFELKQRVAVRVGVVDVQRCAIPRRTLVVVRGGVYAVVGIIAVWQADRCPQRYTLGLTRLHGAQHLPDGQVGTHKLPTFIQCLPDLCASSGCQQTGEG